MKNKPLNGIKILDFSWVFSAPFSTLLLQDLGAEIIKVERPGKGDRSRSIPPFKGNTSGYFYMLNRGKKSISLDLKSEEGKQMILNMAEHFDVVVENFTAGTMDNMGVGYEELKGINPGIIFASLNGFGSSGPYANLPAIDCIAQAMGGLMSQTGYKDEPPLKTGPAVADTVAGIYLATGILSALLNRTQTGIGQKLEVSMMDSVFTLLEESVIRASMTGDALNQRGNTDPLGAPWDTFQTKDDKWVMVCCSDGDKFYDIYQFIGRDDIAEEYKGNDASSFIKRSKHLEQLNGIFAEWTITQTSSELTLFCHKIGITAGEVKSVNDLLEDEQLKSRQMITDAYHPELGNIKLPNMPIHFFNQEKETENQNIKMEPDLGEHNEQILKTVLGMDETKIKELYRKGILYH